MEAASGICAKPTQRAGALGRAVSRPHSAAARPRRSRTHWSLALRAWSPIRFIRRASRCGPSAGASCSTTFPSARSEAGPTLRMPAADRRRHRRGGPRTHPARAPERALRCRCRQRARRDPDARCRGHDPARQSGGGAGIRLPADELIGQSMAFLLERHGRVEQGLQGASSTARTSAVRSSSRRGARTARRAISRPRRRAGRARDGPSSPPSCATSTSGAWPSRRCAC